MSDIEIVNYDKIREILEVSLKMVTSEDERIEVLKILDESVKDEESQLLSKDEVNKAAYFLEELEEILDEVGGITLDEKEISEVQSKLEDS